MSDNQITGNMGMYYVCFKLSERGWNVMPTARNAKGIDIVAYNLEGRYVGIQVKTLSARNPVPLGTNLDNVIGDYFCVVVRQKAGNPKVFVMKPGDVKERQDTSKDGKHSHWLSPKQYELFSDDDLTRII